MSKEFVKNDVNKNVKELLDTLAEDFIILGISNDRLEIKSLLSEETVVSYILDSLVGLILKRANKYEERLEETLFFTRKTILTELERRIIKNFK